MSWMDGRIHRRGHGDQGDRGDQEDQSNHSERRVQGCQGNQRNWKSWGKRAILASLFLCMGFSMESLAKRVDGGVTQREEADSVLVGSLTVAMDVGTGTGSGGTASEGTAAAKANEGAVSSDGTASSGGTTAEAAAGISAEEADAAASDGTAAEGAGQSDGATPQEAEDAENPYLIFSNGRYVDISKPMVALTYDDGPRAANGNRIMDLLEQYNGRATFFLVGNMVNANKAEVQRMAADGMEVANHSWDHQYFNKLGAAAIQSEVSKCNAAIYEACGVMPTLIRLPGGNITNTVRANVSMPMIYWTIDTRDWQHRSAAKTIEHVVGKVKDGDIVLMHEIWDSTVAAQETIIPALANQGFQLVTVSELAAFRGYVLGTGVQYVSFPMKAQ